MLMILLGQGLHSFLLVRHLRVNVDQLTFEPMDSFPGQLDIGAQQVGVILGGTGRGAS